MPKRRSGYDLLTQIVQTCLEPVKKTQIYNRIEAHPVRARHWLGVAINLKLVEKTGSHYRTTKKGKGALEAWTKFKSFLKE